MNKKIVSIMLFVLLFLPLGLSINPVSWDFYREITIDSNRIGTNLTDFVVPVILNSTHATVFENTNSTGADIRFTRFVNGTQDYRYEIERWTNITQEDEVWVRIDNVPNNFNDTFYMWYGNSLATPGSNGVLTWTGTYDHVNHYNQTFTDSLATINQTDQGTDDIEGMIGRGRDCVSANTDYIETNDFNANWLYGSVSFWFNTTQDTATNKYFFGTQAVGVNPTLGAFSKTDEIFRFWTRNVGGGLLSAAESNSSIDDGVWHLAHMSWSDVYGNTLYLDGVLHENDPTAVSDDGMDREMHICSLNTAGGPSLYLDSSIDEWRFVNGTIFSPDYIASDYYAQSNQLLTIGAQTSNAVATITATDLQDGTAIQAFSVNATNGTLSFFQHTTTGSVTGNDTVFPSGTVTIITNSTGYFDNTTVFTGLTLPTSINILLDKPSFFIDAFDINTLADITFNSTCTNSTGDTMSFTNVATNVTLNYTESNVTGLITCTTEDFAGSYVSTSLTDTLSTSDQASFIHYLIQSASCTNFVVNVQTIAGSSISGATVTIERFISGSWTTINVGTTDGTGNAAFCLEAAITHRVTVNTTSFGSTQVTWTPTASNPTLFIRLGESTGPTYTTFFEGVSYYYVPSPCILLPSVNNTINLTTSSPTGLLASSLANIYVNETLNISNSGSTSTGDFVVNFLNTSIVDGGNVTYEILLTKIDGSSFRLNTSCSILSSVSNVTLEDAITRNLCNMNMTSRDMGLIASVVSIGAASTVSRVSTGAIGGFAGWIIMLFFYIIGLYGAGCSFITREIFVLFSVVVITGVIRELKG